MVSGTISNEVGSRQEPFVLDFASFERTHPSAQERSFLCGWFSVRVDDFHPCPLYSLDPCQFIISVLPTKHLFGH